MWGARRPPLGHLPASDRPTGAADGGRGGTTSPPAVAALGGEPWGTPGLGELGVGRQGFRSPGLSGCPGGLRCSRCARQASSGLPPNPGTAPPPVFSPPQTQQHPAWGTGRENRRFKARSAGAWDALGVGGASQTGLPTGTAKGANHSPPWAGARRPCSPAAGVGPLPGPGGAWHPAGICLCPGCISRVSGGLQGTPHGGSCEAEGPWRGWAPSAWRLRQSSEPPGAQARRCPSRRPSAGWGSPSPRRTLCGRPGPAVRWEQRPLPRPGTSRGGQRQRPPAESEEQRR